MHILPVMVAVIFAYDSVIIFTIRKRHHINLAFVLDYRNNYIVAIFMTIVNNIITKYYKNGDINDKI